MNIYTSLTLIALICCNVLCLICISLLHSVLKDTNEMLDTRLEIMSRYADRCLKLKKDELSQ